MFLQLCIAIQIDDGNIQILAMWTKQLDEPKLEYNLILLQILVQIINWRLFCLYVILFILKQ